MQNQILSPEDSDLVRQFFAMFHVTFDRETREPDSQIWEELEGRYRLPIKILAFHADGQLTGFARFTSLPQSNAAWLIHLAVAEPLRGRGLGTQILHRVLEMAHAPVFVEADRGSPVEKWYMREGFSDICPEYVQPALHADTLPVPLTLLCSQAVGDYRAATLDFYREAWNVQETAEIVQIAMRSF